MNPREISLVQDSFRAVAPIADQAAALFYARLFELDPALRALFHGDMREQGRKLMAILGVAVGSLEKLDQILPAVRQLGVRHAGYGVHDGHYATVGAALLWTLEKGLGSAFTTEVRAAWTTVYSSLASTMLDAAHEAKNQAA